MEGFVDAAVAALGGLDVLLNNAGIAGPTAPVEDVTPAELDAVLQVDLAAMFHCARRAVPALRAAGGGSIVNLSSAAGKFGFPLRSPYAAAKWGVVGFTRTLAREIGADGITVNCITPGAIHVESELHVHPDQEALKARLDEQQSIKRRGLPSDIAAAVVFFTSEDASFITGQTLNVDGGWAMH